MNGPMMGNDDPNLWFTSNTSHHHQMQQQQYDQHFSPSSHLPSQPPQPMYQQHNDPQMYEGPPQVVPTCLPQRNPRLPIKELNKAYDYSGREIIPEQVKDDEDSQWIFDDEDGWVPNPTRAHETHYGQEYDFYPEIRARERERRQIQEEQNFSSKAKRKQESQVDDEYMLLSEHPAKGLGARITAVLGGDVVTVIGSQTGNEPLDNSAAPPPPAPEPFPRAVSPRSGSGLKRSSPVDPSKKQMYQSKVTDRVTVSPIGNRALPETSNLSRKEIWKNSTRTESMLWSTIEEDADFGEQRLTNADPSVKYSQATSDGYAAEREPSINVTAPQDFLNRGHRLPQVPSKSKRGSFERQNEISLPDACLDGQNLYPAHTSSHQQESFRSNDQQIPSSIQSHFQQPASSPRTSMYQQPQTSMYQQPQVSMYQKPQTSVQQPPQTSMFQHPQTSMYQDPQTSIFQQPQTSVYQDPQTSMYQQAQTSQFQELQTSQNQSSQKIQTSSFQSPQSSQFQQLQTSQFQQPHVSQFQQTPTTSQFQQQPQTSVQQQPSFSQFQQQPQTSQFQVSSANHQFSDQTPRIIEPSKTDYFDQTSSHEQPSDQLNHLQQQQQLPPQSALKSEGRLTVEQKTVTFSDTHREHTFNTSQESGSSSYIDSTEQSVPTSIDQYYDQTESVKKHEPPISTAELVNGHVPVEQYTNGYGVERPKSPSIQKDDSMFPSTTEVVSSEQLKDQVSQRGGEEVVSALKEFEPPNTEGMSKARIRWLAAFNKIVSEMVEVSFFSSFHPLPLSLSRKTSSLPLEKVFSLFLLLCNS